MEVMIKAADYLWTEAGLNAASLREHFIFSINTQHHPLTTYTRVSESAYDTTKKLPIYCISCGLSQIYSNFLFALTHKLIAMNKNFYSRFVFNERHNMS